MVFVTPITAITTNTTLSLDIHMYIIDASSGNITITLPAITASGIYYILNRIDTSINAVTISAAQPIVGSALITPLTPIQLVSNNNTWYRSPYSTSVVNRQQVFLSSGVLVTSTSDRNIGFFNANPNGNAVVAAAPGVISDLYVKLSSVVNITVRLYVNGIATPLVVTISGGNLQGHNTAITVPVNAGDRITVAHATVFLSGSPNCICTYNYST